MKVFKIVLENEGETALSYYMQVDLLNQVVIKNINKKEKISTDIIITSLELLFLIISLVNDLNIERKNNAVFLLIREKCLEDLEYFLGDVNNDIYVLAHKIISTIK